jgi:hypothetical protein
VANLGWTWDQALDQLTVPRYLALVAEWRRSPPVHWLVATALNYKSPGEPSPSRQPMIAELKAALPGGAL